MGSAWPCSTCLRGLFLIPNRQFGKCSALFAAVYGRNGQGVREVVDAFGLSPVLNQPVGRLSKGWRRRLLVAIGLLTPQPVLLMDEAFDGFDLRQTRDAMNDPQGRGSRRGGH